MSDVTKIKLPDNSEYNIKDYRIPGVDSTPTSGSNNVVTSGGVYQAINDDALVISTALNDLNDRITDVESATSVIDNIPTENSTNLVTSGGVYSTIIENELATASALNDLYDRVSDNEDNIDSLQTDSVWEAGTGTNSIIVKTSGGIAGGNNSTVEGKGCVTGGTHTEYDLTPDTTDATAGSYAHAEGRYTIACGKQGSHAEGDRTLASGAQAHAEGGVTVASGQYSHAEGGLTKATAGGAHAEGVYSIASGSYSHAEGQGSVSSSIRSHAEGYYSLAAGSQSHAECDRSIARGISSHSESLSCSYGLRSHVEGGDKGIDVFPVGAANATSYTSTWDTEFDSIRNAIGDTALCNIIKGSAILTKSATAMNPIIITDASLSNNTLSFTLEKTLSNTALDGSVNYWITFSIAYGVTSHSENSGNVSYGGNSHAEGSYNVALGEYSHVEGLFTFTNNASEHAEGSYNLSTKTSTTYGDAGNTQHSIGIGTSSARKNAVEVMQNGDAYLYGVGSYDGTNYSSASSLQTVISGKQDTLVSGTSIKTINNESLLGSGNITISGGSGSGSGTAEKAFAIPFGSVDSTSTSTAFTATVDSFPSTLSDGVCAYIYNGVVTSASGCTLNINNTGAKPIYNTMEASTAVTTTFNVAYTMLFVYNSTRVSGGCWDMFYGYYSTVQYRLRYNSASRTVTSALYRYRLLFSSADNTQWVPANSSSSTNATAARTVPQTKINPFGPIVYYGTTTSVSSGGTPTATTLYEQYAITLGYSFNRTGAALTLTSKSPVYIKCAPQSDGSAIIDEDNPYVQTLPSTADGKIYIYLGIAYSATAVEMNILHPVYYYKNGAIRFWTGDPANYLSLSGGTMNNDASINLIDSDQILQTNIWPGVISVSNAEDYYSVSIDSSSPGITVEDNSVMPKTSTRYGTNGVVYWTANASYAQSFPAKSGTFAMTSDIPIEVVNNVLRQNGNSNSIKRIGGDDGLEYALGIANADGDEDLILATTDLLPAASSLLPSVTSSDNGKVLTVVSGSWTAATASGGNVSDVTVGGTSVVSNGVAAIPAIPTVPTISTDVASDKANNNKVTGAKAVYDEIHPAVENSQPVGGFEPNILYDLGTITGTVTFTMASPTDATIINHYYWTFETSSTAPTITWPSGVTSWFGGSAPTVSASKHYEISVLDGVGCFMEV